MDVGVMYGVPAVGANPAKLVGWAEWEAERDQTRLSSGRQGWGAGESLVALAGGEGERC